MKKRTILLAFIISAVAMTSGCSSNEPKTDEVKQEQTKTESVSSGVTIKPLTQMALDENPYMAKNDANIHHDCYNSDSTDEVLPVGIYPEINVSYEKVNPNASPAVFFDNYGKTGRNSWSDFFPPVEKKRLHNDVFNHIKT